MQNFLLKMNSPILLRYIKVIKIKVRVGWYFVADCCEGQACLVPLIRSL